MRVWRKENACALLVRLWIDAAAAAKSLQSCPTSVQPHRRQPTSLRHPWDSPGKNTGVGCISFSNAWKWKVWKWSCSVVSESSRPHGLQPTRLLCPWDFLGKSTGVGCHCLFWWTDVATLKNNMKFPQNTENRTTIWSSNSTAGNISKENELTMS